MTTAAHPAVTRLHVPGRVPVVVVATAPSTRSPLLWFVTVTSTTRFPSLSSPSTAVAEIPTGSWLGRTGTNDVVAGRPHWQQATLKPMNTSERMPPSMADTLASPLFPKPELRRDGAHARPLITRSWIDPSFGSNSKWK